MTRIACFYVPLFVLAARLRSEPELRTEALAIVDGNGTSAHVLAATRRARTKGILPGHSLAQARSILPKLIARGRDAECERTAQEALLEIAETFSPRIEDAGQGVVFLDVTGMERHFQHAGQQSRDAAPVSDPKDDAVPRVPRSSSEFLGQNEPERGTEEPRNRGTEEPRNPRNRATEEPRNPRNRATEEPRNRGTEPATSADDLVSAEHRLAAAAIHAADKIGLSIRVGIAASKLAARVAAELPKSPTIVAPGSEAEFLAPLPLTRLSPALDAAATLRRWGIGSIGELANLPESEVASRLGDLGRELHYAARGIDPRPLMPRALPPEFREGMELEWPLVALEPFLFIASAALDRLAERLAFQGFACKRIELTMNLDPDGFHSRAIDLPAPTRDVKTILTLLRLDLEKTPPGAPVTGFSLVAHPDRPRRAQLSLFGPAALSPEKLATTIARLISMLGEENVGMPVTVDGYMPERFGVSAYEPPPPPEMKRKPRKSRGLLAARLFRPPIPVEVITRPARDDEPGDIQIAAIHGDGDLNGDVRVSSGPWQLEESWWSDTPDTREYWDVELVRGSSYRVYRGGAVEWYADAEYA